MRLRKFRSQFRIVGFALRGPQARINLCARLIDASRRLIGWTQRRIKVVTLRITPKRIHAVELVFSLGPSSQTLRSLHLDPPILTALSNDLGSAVPQTACVVLLCNESAIVFSPPLALGPNVCESLSPIHVPQNAVARLKSQFRQGLQHLHSVRF